MKTKKMAPAAAPCRFRECKILSGDNQLQFCDKHYKFHIDFLRNNPSILKKNQLDLLGSETPDLTKKKKKEVKNQSSILPPDEERCCRIGSGRWRCKNYRMKTKNYCEQHCRSIFQHNKDRLMKNKEKKKKSGAGLVTETRDSNRRPGKRQPTDQPSSSNAATSSDAIVGAGSVNIGAKRKRVGRLSGGLESLTGIRGPVVETRASKRRKMVMAGDETSNQLVTNDNIESDGIVGSGEPVTELESVELYRSNCSELSTELEKMKVELEKTKVELEKKKVESTELQGKLAEVEETRMSTAEDEKATEYWRKRCSDLESLVQRMGNETSTITQTGEKQRDENNMSEATTSSDRITESASPNVRAKMKNVESTEVSGEPVNDQLLYQSNCIELVMEPEKNELELEKNDVELEENVKSTKGSGEPVIDQLESVELYQSNCMELSMEPEKDNVEFEKVKTELEKDEVELEKNVESTNGSGIPVNDQLENVELCKSNCFELSMDPETNEVELEKVKAELDKNEIELPKNEVELEKNKVELEKNKMELEKNKVDLEKMKAQLDKKKVECTEFQDNLAEVEETKKSTSKDEYTTENSTIGCVDTCISNLVSLVPGNGKESSVLRCQELSYSEKEESEAQGLQHEITQSGENQRDEDMSKPNAEAIGEGSKDSSVDELKTEENVLNVEEGKGCSEEGVLNGSSQADLEMCNKTSFNLVSDSNGGDDSLGAEDSVRDSMDMNHMIVPGNGKESLLLICQELSYSEKVESEAWDLEIEITQTGEKQRDKDMSKPNAETRGEESKDSYAYELKTEEKVQTVEEGKGWGCSEERPSQNGSSSQADLEMCKKTSVNLVDGGDSPGAEDSLGDLMDMTVPGNGNESSILRCLEVSYSENVESEAQGLQKEITQTGENQRDKDMSKPNAEAIGEGSKDSRVDELKTEEKVLNVEEGKGWGCSVERPSQHGSSSQADLEMCNKTSLNLVSDSNVGGDSLGAEDSLGDSMNMLAMKILNMNKDKMAEADMLSSVEDCMKVVGDLYQQETSKD